MMDRFEAMSILLLTVDKGSFSAAARALRMPLPTLSRKVGELESHIGAKLLARTTRSLALTDAGAAYVVAARRILDQVEEAERIAAGEFTAPRGELILTAPLLFGRLHLLPIVADFLAAYPEIEIRLLFSDRNLHLIEDHVDMAVRIGALPDSSLVATRVGAMRTVVCASPALLAERGEPRAPQDLAGWPAVSFDKLSPSSSWEFATAGTRTTVTLAQRLSVSTAEAAVWAAARSVGATRVLRYQCEPAVRDGALRIVLCEFEPPPLPVSLLHAGRASLPLKTRIFLEFAAARLREALR